MPGAQYRVTGGGSKSQALLAYGEGGGCQDEHFSKKTPAVLWSLTKHSRRNFLLGPLLNFLHQHQFRPIPDNLQHARQ